MCTLAPLVQAVVRLPFPDVAAISEWVAEQLGGGGEGSEEDGEGGGDEVTVSREGCRLTDEERARNEFRPAVLLASAEHPLAPRLLAALSGEQPPPAAAAGDAAEAPAEPWRGDPGDAAADCASIVSLLLPPAVGGSAGERQGVLSLPLDLAGADTPAFSAGLLPGALPAMHACWCCGSHRLCKPSCMHPDAVHARPEPEGTEEGDQAISLKAWNKRKADQQRRQVERLRQGRGRGRDGSSRGGRGHDGSGRGGRGGRGRGGVSAGAPAPVPLARALPSGAAVAPPPRPLSQREQQELADADVARRLQRQFDAEARSAAAAAAAPWVPPAGFSMADVFGSSAWEPAPLASTSASSGGGFGGSWGAPAPLQPVFSSALSRSSGGSRAYWPTADAFVSAGGWADEVETVQAAPAAPGMSAAAAAAAAAAVEEEEEELGEVMPWLAMPALPAVEEPAAGGAQQPPDASEAAAAGGVAAIVEADVAETAEPSAEPTSKAARPAGEEGSEEDLGDLLGMLGVA